MNNISAAPRGRRMSIARALRLPVEILLLLWGVYAFWRLWSDPSTPYLHAPLALIGGALVLLLMAAIAVKRIRSPKRDEKSVLHL